MSALRFTAAALLAALIGGCGQSTLVPLDELTVRAAVARRGSELSLAMACGANSGRVADFAARDSVPAGVSPAFTERYRADVGAKVLAAQAVRGTGSAPASECAELQRRPEYASLWRPERPTAPASAPRRRSGAQSG